MPSVRLFFCNLTSPRCHDFLYVYCPRSHAMFHIPWFLSAHWNQMLLHHVSDYVLQHFSVCTLITMCTKLAGAKLLYVHPKFTNSGP